MKAVTQADFQFFIKNYPRRLVKDDNFISEPPIRTYFDETLSKSLFAQERFRECMVAEIKGNRDGQFEYFIKDEVQS